MNFDKKIFAERICKKQKELRKWFTQRTQEAIPPLYCSVDLRDAGYKLSPVDCNLYPAGFNNICHKDQLEAQNVVKRYLNREMEARKLPPAKKILVLPESNTRNSFYIENLYSLVEILKGAGFETDIGWYPSLSSNQEVPNKLLSASEKKLIPKALTIKNHQLLASNTRPDLVILNNDFSDGYPSDLDTVIQPILPSHKLGWHSRKKSEHFNYYNELCAQICEILDIDPFHLQIQTTEVKNVHFNSGQGMDRVQDAVDSMLSDLRERYQRNSITQEPFVFIKNNSGTYGMGIMTVKSSDDLKDLNRRTKNKMSSGKSRSEIHSVIVQEGVPTATTVSKLTAEPVIYLIGCELVGGFLRTHSSRSANENLNSQGMVFKKLCMSDLPKLWESQIDDLDSMQVPENDPSLELVYGTVARLSALALGREILSHTRS